MRQRLRFILVLFTAALAALGATLSACSGLQEHEEAEETLATAVPLLNDLAGSLGSAPAVTRWGSRLDVWVRGSNGNIWHQACLSNCGSAANWLGWEQGAGAPAGGISGDPGAAAWGTGRIDLFVRSAGSLWHQTWVDGSGWLGWENLGGSIDGSPTAVSWASGRIDVYVRGTDGQIWHRPCNTGNCRGANWGAWNASPGKPSPGASTSRPAVVSWAANRLDLFVRGSDDAVWHTAWTGSSYTPWASIGGAVTSGLGAATWGVNRLDVFGRGSDNQLWVRTYDERPGWRAWETLSTPPTGAPAAISTGPGTMNVFYRSVTDSLRHISCNGDDNCKAPPTTTIQAGPNRVAAPFRLDIVARASGNNNIRLTRCDGTACDGSSHSPINLGPALDSGPAITRWGARVDVFARGTDGGIWHNACLYGCGAAANFGGWSSSPGRPPNPITSEPSAIAWAEGRIDLFVRSNNELWHQTWQNGTGWLGWENLGGSIISAPCVTSAFRNKLDVYAVGSDGHLWRRACTTGNCRGASWGAWQLARMAPAAGLAASRPGPAAWNSTRTDVYVRGGDGRLYQTINTGAGFGAFQDLGTPTGTTISSGVAAAVTPWGRVDVVATAANGRLHRWNWPANAWNDLGVTAQDAPGLLSYEARQGENTSVVVAPGHPSCPNGRAFVSLGPSRTILQADLNCIGGASCVEYAFPPDPGDISEFHGSNDNILRVASDGRLLYTKQTFINDGGAANPSAPVRVVEQFWASSDCGRSWQVQGRIDQNNFGVPVRNQVCNSNAPPGYDRVETYIDPFNGSVYATASLTTGNASGSGCDRWNTLYRSNNFGQTWTLANNQFGGSVPFKMTSTPNALVLFACNPAPMVIWSRDGGSTYFWDMFNGQTCQSNPTFGGAHNGSTGVTRVGFFPPNRDTVRVNFPVAGSNAGRQAIRIASVRLNRADENGRPPFSLIETSWTTDATLGRASDGSGDATDPNTSLVQFSAIEPHDGSNTALYYWRELNPASSNDPTVRVKYRAVRGADGFSSSASAASGFLLSADPGWSVPGGPGWWGDYVQSGYYGSQGNPGNYLLQWSQGESGFTVIKTRTVTVAQVESQ